MEGESPRERIGWSGVVCDEVRPAGFEPATLGSEDRCAIQLRHGRKPAAQDKVFETDLQAWLGVGVLNGR